MIIIKSEKEIEAMREGGIILAKIMKEIGESIAPGKSTWKINKLAEELVFDNGGKAIFKGYGQESGHPFPAGSCISLNDEVVHGIPKEDRIIHEGDLVKVDIGMKYKGMITDMARTFAVGKISEKAQKLMETTNRCLDLGIDKLKAGNTLGDYSKAVQKYSEGQGFSVIRALVGHGVGKELHEDPYIPNFASPKSPENKIVLKEGMTLALEPMLNEGNCNIKLGKDGWTYQTEDGKLSAHFEDTVVIREDGAEMLTRV